MAVAVPPYVPAYGYRPYRETTLGEALKKVARVLLALIGLAIMLLFFISLPLGVNLFLTTPQGQELLAKHIRNLYIFLLVVPVEIPVKLPVSGVLWGLMAIFIACFVASAIQGGGIHQAISGLLDRPLSKSMRNPLFALPFWATATLAVSFILTIVVEALGSEVAPTFEVENALVLVLEASYAAVAEEVGIRLVGVGLPLALAVLLKAEEDKGLAFLKALFCPPALDKRLWRELRLWAWAWVVISAVIFGFLHLLGWTPGKVPVATAAGLILGACFVLYGLHTSILVHWFLNYHIQVIAAWGLLSGNPGDALLAGLLLLGELVVGFLSLIMFLVQGIRMLASRRTRPTAAKPAVYYPSWWY